MPGEDRVHDLRHHRVVVSHDARKYRVTLAQPRHQVLAQLIFYPPRAETLCSERTLAQLAESPGNTHDGNPQKKQPYADYTAASVAVLSDELRGRKDTLLRDGTLQPSAGKPGLRDADADPYHSGHRGTQGKPYRVFLCGSSLCPLCPLWSGSLFPSREELVPARL